MKVGDTMDDNEFICCICGKTVREWGNNPFPLGKDSEECCDFCNISLVIPARLRLLKEGMEDEKRAV